MAELLDGYQNDGAELCHINAYEMPSMNAVEDIFEQCRALLFPGYFGPSMIDVDDLELSKSLEQRVLTLRGDLRRQMYRGLHKVAHKSNVGDFHCADCTDKSKRYVASFMSSLVSLRKSMVLDVKAHFSSDPAAKGLDEVILCYPGVLAIAAYRIAHQWLQSGVKLLPRMLSEIAHRRVGIEIHPGASIGQSFFIDHGTGVVIGETADIGNGVKIYQGVTLGALSIKNREEEHHKRHPTIEDDCVLYAGATILGGDTVIGKGSVIGGNTWVTQSLPPGSRISAQNKTKSG